MLASLQENQRQIESMTNFEDWTKRISRGDEAAFNEFFSLYNVRLWRLALLLARGNEDLAKEVHQVTMIKAARKFKPFKTDAELWAWLSRIAHNAWVDQIKKGGLLSRLMTFLSGEEQALPDLPSDERVWEHLDEALSQLDPDDQTIVQSIYFEKMSHAEAAEKFGTTSKAVERKVSRIRARIRLFILKCLKNEARN